MNKSKINWEQFEEKYNSVFQIRAMLADPQFLFGELGRGSGKTVEIMAPRLLRVSYDMPRSTLLLASATYTSLINTIVPVMTTYLEQHYTRGVHFVSGIRPPKHFKFPYTPILDYKHTISFAWGTVVQLVSVDRPESAIGKNAAHLFCDEMLRIKEVSMTERVIPTLRGDRQIHGKSQYFAGITGFSSTPNFENDHDWWLNYEENMDKDLIEEIMAVAFKVSQARYKLKTTNSENKQKELTRFINKWGEKLREKRKGTTIYLKGSSFTNLRILGMEYIKDQLTSSRSNFDTFKLAVLGIRPKRVGNMFFGKFSKNHIYEDSYQYHNIDLYSVEGDFNKTSRDIKYCNSRKPLIVGLDPGDFMSMVFAQEQNKELRVFKNLYVIHPEQHFEMAQKINEFFKHHIRKTIYLYYDRAGNQRKYHNNPKGETDAIIMRNELQSLGWTVQLMSLRKRTIFFWEHYLLLNILFAEKDSRISKIRLCQYECEELISSIWMSPLKRNEGKIELDKSSEKKLDLKDQAFWSTQIATSLMYLLFGLYEKFLPNKPEHTDYLGL